MPRSAKKANKPNKRATELKPRTCAHQGSMFRPYSGADPGFWKGGAWGVGDKLAVRSSQVCAPGGSEGMPPRNF